MKRIWTYLLLCFGITFTYSCSSPDSAKSQDITKNNSGTEISVEQESTQRSELLQKKEKEIVIGATLASKDSYYLQDVSLYMKEAAREEGIVLDLVYADWDAEIQAEQMNDFIKRKVDAIILCPINAKSMLTSLKKAKEKGIPVINLNMKVDAVSTEYIDTYVGASMSEEGTMAAELLVRALGKQGGKVAIIEGAPGSDAQIYRTQDFIETLKSYPSIEVVAMGNGNWDQAKSYLVARDIINKNPELSAIFAHDSYMAIGAIQAIEELKKQDQIIVIGVGEGEEYYQAMIDGRLYGLITQPPDYEGKYSIYCAVKAVGGEELRPWYKDPIEIITKDKVEDKINENMKK